MAVPIALATLCVAGTAAAHDLQDPRVDRLVAVIAGQGCAMTDAVADAGLPKYGSTRHETREIAATLTAEGRARLERPTRTLKLSGPDCH